MALTFPQLPSDIHICLCLYLTTNDIRALSQTSARLQSVYSPNSWSTCFAKPDCKGFCCSKGSKDPSTPNSGSESDSESSKENNDYYQCQKTPDESSHCQAQFRARNVPIHVVLNPEQYSWFSAASVRTLIIDEGCFSEPISASLNPKNSESPMASMPSSNSVNRNLSLANEFDNDLESLYDSGISSDDVSINSGNEKANMNNSNPGSSDVSSSSSSSSNNDSSEALSDNTGSETLRDSSNDSLSNTLVSRSSSTLADTFITDSNSNSASSLSSNSFNSSSLTNQYKLLEYYSALQNVRIQSEKCHTDVDYIADLLRNSDFVTALLASSRSVDISLDIELGPDHYSSSNSNSNQNNDNNSNSTTQIVNKKTRIVSQQPYIEAISSLKLTVLKFPGKGVIIPNFSNLSTVDLSIPNISQFESVLKQLPMFPHLKSFHSSHTCTLRTDSILVDKGLRSISKLLPRGIQTCVIQMFFVSGNNSNNGESSRDFEIMSLRDPNSFLTFPQVTHIECRALTNDLLLDNFFVCVLFPRLCHFSTPFGFDWSLSMHNLSNNGFSTNLFTSVTELNLFITTTDFELVFLRFLSCFRNLEFLSVSMTGCSNYTADFEGLNSFLKVIRQLYIDNPQIVFKSILDKDLEFLIRQHMPALCIQTLVAKTMLQVVIDLVKQPLRCAGRLARCRAYTQYAFIADAYLWECLFQQIQGLQRFKYLNLHSYGFSHASPRLQRILAKAMDKSCGLQQILFTQQVGWDSFELKNNKISGYAKSNGSSNGHSNRNRNSNNNSNNAVNNNSNNITGNNHNRSNSGNSNSSRTRTTKRKSKSKSPNSSSPPNYTTTSSSSSSSDYKAHKFNDQHAFSNAPVFSSCLSVQIKEESDLYLQTLYDIHAQKYYEPKLITHRLTNVHTQYDSMAQSPFRMSGIGGPVNPKEFCGWV